MNCLRSLTPWNPSRKYRGRDLTCPHHGRLIWAEIKSADHIGHASVSIRSPLSVDCILCVCVSFRCVHKELFKISLCVTFSLSHSNDNNQGCNYWLFSGSIRCLTVQTRRYLVYQQRRPLIPGNNHSLDAGARYISAVLL